MGGKRAHAGTVTCVALGSESQDFVHKDVFISGSDDGTLFGWKLAERNSIPLIDLASLAVHAGREKESSSKWGSKSDGEQSTRSDRSTGCGGPLSGRSSRSAPGESGERRSSLRTSSCGSLYSEAQGLPPLHSDAAAAARAMRGGEEDSSLEVSLDDPFSPRSVSSLVSAGGVDHVGSSNPTSAGAAGGNNNNRAGGRRRSTTPERTRNGTGVDQSGGGPPPLYQAGGSSSSASNNLSGPPTTCAYLPLNVGEVQHHRQMRSWIDRRWQFHGHSGPVWCLRYDFPRRRLFSGGYDSTLKVWNLDSGRCVESLRVAGEDSWVTAIDVLPIQDFVVSGGSDGTVRLWCLQKNQFNGGDFADFGDHDRRGGGSSAVLLGSVKEQQTQNIYSVQFVQQETLLTASAGRSHLYEWDLETKTQKAVYTHGHSDDIYCIHQDGSYFSHTFVTGGKDKLCCFWDARNQARNRPELTFGVSSNLGGYAGGGVLGRKWAIQKRCSGFTQNFYPHSFSVWLISCCLLVCE